MSKTLSQRRLRQLHLSVGREIVDHYFADPAGLEALVDQPDLLRRALIEALAVHPRVGELRGLVRPTTAACLNLLAEMVREAIDVGVLEGVPVAVAQAELIKELDYHISPKTIEEMIRRNHALHDLAIHRGRIRLRADLLVEKIDQRHQVERRQEVQRAWEA